MNELGRRAGLDVSYVARAEKGRNIQPSTAKAFADALGLGYGKEIKVTDIEGLNIVGS